MRVALAQASYYVDIKARFKKSVHTEPIAQRHTTRPFYKFDVSR